VRPSPLLSRLAGRAVKDESPLGAPQGTVAVRLKLGTGIELCGAAPGRSPAAANDTTAKFVGARNTTPPSRCPSVP